MLIGLHGQVIEIVEHDLLVLGEEEVAVTAEVGPPIGELDHRRHGVAP